MLTFTMIPSPEQFLRMVEGSRGEVTLCLPDGGRCDLKRDHTARQLIRAMHPGQEGLCISLTNPEDFTGFMRYMMEAAHD